MADPTLSQAWKEAAASAPAGEVMLHTLEFRHVNFTQPIRVVQAHADISARLEATAPLNALEYVGFIALGFDIGLPETRIGAGAELSIAIDNVSKEIESNLALAAMSPYQVDVTYRCYLASDLTTPANLPPTTMQIKSATAGKRVDARAGFSDPANLKFPTRIYSVTEFPGMNR